VCGVSSAMSLIYTETASSLLLKAASFATT
jgi:hypothetical protein